MWRACYGAGSCPMPLPAGIPHGAEICTIGLRTDRPVASLLWCKIRPYAVSLAAIPHWCRDLHHRPLLR